VQQSIGKEYGKMAASEFHHYGVPTGATHDSEVFLEGGKVHITDATTHPYRIEFLRFEADSPMPDAVKNHPHAAFVVPALDAALEGQNVIIEPFDATDEFRVAFITDGDAVIELMERR
jgi:hypothetical protein